jgi:hypothetical protein
MLVVNFSVTRRLEDRTPVWWLSVQTGEKVCFILFKEITSDARVGEIYALKIHTYSDHWALR